MRKMRKNRGYTLVELLIAIVLTGILFTVTWVMFATSSDMLGEVDNLTHASDRLRFAMERVRTDVQMAGSMATVDSDQDAWVRPQNTNWYVTGVYSYTGWQDDRSVLSMEQAAANPNVSFDGFVLLGAYDNPLPFEIANVAADMSSATIAGDARGLQKLHVPDPFRTDPSYPIDFSDYANDIEPMSHQWTSRIMRVMDASGFMQFVAFDDPLDSGDMTMTGSGTDAIRVDFDTATRPLQAKTTGVPFGLDASAESDRAYDATLLDVFWYRVRQDPNDPASLQLVRERLCGPSVAFNAAANFAMWNPANHTLPNMACPGSDTEVIVITDNIVDFQVWFDCANAPLGSVVNQNWSVTWTTPTTGGMPCMNPASPSLGLARVAHIRLSLRADNERPSLQHYQFEDTAGNTCDPAAPAACTSGGFPGARLRTFDVVPGLEGATPVITLQADVALPNYTFR